MLKEDIASLRNLDYLLLLSDFTQTLKKEKTNTEWLGLEGILKSV